MKSSLCVLLIVSMTCLSCAGLEPNPVRSYLPGDERKSSKVLQAEIADIDRTLVHKRREKSKQEFENILWFCGGCVVIVPFFFIDLKENEKAEIEALLNRQGSLRLLLLSSGAS